MISFNEALVKLQLTYGIDFEEKFQRTVSGGGSFQTAMKVRDDFLNHLFSENIELVEAIIAWGLDRANPGYTRYTNTLKNLFLWPINVYQFYIEGKETSFKARIDLFLDYAKLSKEEEMESFSKCWAHNNYSSVCRHTMLELLRRNPTLTPQALPPSGHGLSYLRPVLSLLFERGYKFSYWGDFTASPNLNGLDVELWGKIYHRELVFDLWEIAKSGNGLVFSWTLAKIQTMKDIPIKVEYKSSWFKSWGHTLFYLVKENLYDQAGELIEKFPNIRWPKDVSLGPNTDYSGSPQGCVDFLLKHRSIFPQSELNKIMIGLVTSGNYHQLKSVLDQYGSDAGIANPLKELCPGDIMGLVKRNDLSVLEIVLKYNTPSSELLSQMDDYCITYGYHTMRALLRDYRWEHRKVGV